MPSRKGGVPTFLCPTTESILEGIFPYPTEIIQLSNSTFMSVRVVGEGFRSLHFVIC